MRFTSGSTNRPSSLRARSWPVRLLPAISIAVAVLATSCSSTDTDTADSSGNVAVDAEESFGDSTTVTVGLNPFGLAVVDR